MNDDPRRDQVTRGNISKLLFDDEIARVSTGETADRVPSISTRSRAGATPVVDAQGRLTGILITNRDIWRAWGASQGVFSEGVIRVLSRFRMDVERLDLNLIAGDVAVFFVQEDRGVQQRIREDRGEGPRLSLGGSPMLGPADTGAFMQHARRTAEYARRERSESFGDHYREATLFWNSLSVREREHLVLSARFELGKVENEDVWLRVVAQFRRVDGELARRVARGLRHPSRESEIVVRAR